MLERSVFVTWKRGAMGSFFVSFHVRSTDRPGVAAAVQKRAGGHSRILEPLDGWISFYEQQASSQDDSWITKLLGHISADVTAPAIAFLCHDSDVACYWLFDRGRLVDSYNSCPGYFDDGPTEPQGGDVKLLAEYARNTSADELAEILKDDPTFADDIIVRLAEALGIDPERATSDYRDDDDESIGDNDSTDDDDDDDDDDDGPRATINLAEMRAKAQQQMQSWVDAINAGSSSDPEAVALVEAAAAGHMTELRRLIQAGVDLNRSAIGPLPQASQQPLARTIPGMLKIAMLPLMAATLNSREEVVRLLLDAGADPNVPHCSYGSTIHAAVAVGSPTILRLLLDHGGQADLRDANGQTPLDLLAGYRLMAERLASVQEMAKSMGKAGDGIVPEHLRQLAEVQPGWAECEAILRERAGRVS